jgi:hypothetical protein
MRYLRVITLILMPCISYADQFLDLNKILQTPNPIKKNLPEGTSTIHNEVFVIRNVEVSASSTDNYNAKIEAVNQGIKESYSTMLKRILPAKDHWRIENMRFDEIYQTVSDVRLQHERITALSYKAVADIYYDQEALKKLLYSQGVFFISQYSDEYLVVPVLCHGEKCWTSYDEKWDDAWGNLPLYYGLLKLKYLLHDLNDETLFDYANSMSATLDQFKGLQERYGTRQFILIKADVRDEGFTVNVRHLSPDADTIFNTFYRLQDQDSTWDLYHKMALDTLDEMDTFYKKNKQ